MNSRELARDAKAVAKDWWRMYGPEVPDQDSEEYEMWEEPCIYMTRSGIDDVCFPDFWQGSSAANAAVGVSEAKACNVKELARTISEQFYHQECGA